MAAEIFFRFHRSLFGEMKDTRFNSVSYSLAKVVTCAPICCCCFTSVLAHSMCAFRAGGSERTQAQVLADAVLMVGDRLLPTGAGVDRLGVGSHLPGGEPQDLPVNLQGRLLGKFAEHTHEGDLVGEPQLIVAAPPQGDLASGGLEKAGLANQTGAETSGSETGTGLSGTNARSGRTV